MNTQNMLKWITDLETTDAGQTQGALCEFDDDDEPSYCCLGRTCEVAMADGLDIVARRTGLRRVYDYAETMPTDGVKEWLGVTDEDLIGKAQAPIFEPLRKAQAPIFEPLPLGADREPRVDEFYEVCAEWNDTRGASFKDIAAKLRATFDLPAGADG